MPNGEALPDGAEALRGQKFQPKAGPPLPRRQAGLAEKVKN